MDGQVYGMTTRAALRPAAFALAYAVCAFAALAATSGEDGIAAVWPASGVFLAGLILLEGRQRHILLGGVAVASMAANLWVGVGILAAIGYTLANLAEGGIALAVMRALGLRRQLFVAPRSFAIFVLAAFVAGLASAAMAGLLSGNGSRVFLSSWASTVILGMLTVTPTIMFIANDRAGRSRLASLDGLLTLAVTAALSALAFGQSDLPLLFLPMAALSFATFAVGLSGAAVAVVVVAAIGSVLTALNLGPVSVFLDATPDRVLFFQGYLFALVVSVLPVAVLLARRQEDLARIENSHRLLELAERSARVGHWRFSLKDRQIYWSAEALRVAGYPRDSRPTLDDALEIHLPEERERVSALVALALREGLPFTYEARMRRADGEIRVIECRAQVERDDTDTVIALFGTVVDVSRRTAPGNRGTRTVTA